MRTARPGPVAVVDDDAAVRESLRFLLEAAGFSVTLFASAQAFLAAPDQPAPACILLDQHMPAMTGIEMLRQLPDASRTIPVALMTGSPSDELARQAVSLGATLVLAKPLIEAELLRFIEAAGR
jgi:two-component system response regulator FixJ